MDDNDRRNIKDFYTHRKLVLERIKRSIEQEKKEAQEMNVYYNNSFTGHWPVGTAAVVVAPNNMVAAEMLEEELKNQRLPQKIDPKAMVRLSTYRLSVTILNDGDY